MVEGVVCSSRRTRTTVALTWQSRWMKGCEIHPVEAQHPHLQAGPGCCSLEICSTGLCPKQASSFHRDDSNFVSVAQTTAKTGIRTLLPHADIDDYLFEPCGYSMNGLEDDGVASTIHITPEEHCSYASLEVTGPLQASSMAALAQDPDSVIEDAAAIFRPSHMAVAMSWTATEHMHREALFSCPSGQTLDHSHCAYYCTMHAEFVRHSGKSVTVPTSAP